MIRARLKAISRALAALLLAASALGGLPSTVAADDRPTIKVDPATQTVAPGQAVTVTLVQSAAITTTGAQVTVNFDPKLLQLKDFALAQPYASASAVFAFGNVDLGTANNKSAALKRANKFGTLDSVAGFLLPGSGTLAAGDTAFLTLSFVGQPGAGGEAAINLAKGQMLDETGQVLDPHLNPGAVTVGEGGAPGGSGPLPSGSAEASAEPSGIPSEAPATPPTSPTTAVLFSVAPTSLTLAKGDSARIFLIADADGNISSAAADLTFDPKALQITGIEVGPSWSGATTIAVATDAAKRGVDGAVQEANTTGVLHQVGAFFTPGTEDLPYGEGVVVSVLVQASTDIKATPISIDKAAALGASGETLADAAIDPASRTPLPPKAFELDPLLVGLVAVLLVVVGGPIILVRTGRVPTRVRRRWPFYVALLLALVPVGLFLGLVALMVVNSAPVLADPGLKALLGPDYSSKYSGQDLGQFGLQPALFGTVLMALIATAIAVPIALTLAVVAVDFPMGPITRLVRPAVSLMSGIPPIVYAVSVPAFITLFMIPKFAGNTTYPDFNAALIGADPATWPPADVPFNAGSFPWDLTGTSNSTLLAGLLVGLFLVPFTTPLFVDALRDVPRAAREASLALGASRTYTIRRVVLPRALPAIAGAITLGVLKALGDTLIVAFAAGWAAEHVPSPIFDVLERTPSLAAQGTGQILSVESLGASCLPAECAVGYTSGLFLLLVAGVVVVVMSYLQARGRRRVAV